MKVYVIKYRHTGIMLQSDPQQNRDRIESFDKVEDFLGRLRFLKNSFFAENVTSYIGEVKEVDVDDVLGAL